MQFYAATHELMDGVGAYLSSGLTSGGAAVVVATAAHRSGFERALTARGVDVEAARRARTLIEHDADDVLATFAHPAGLDQARFDAVVGQLLMPALRQGRPVRIYGEMVARLWARGEVVAALELEKFWNELGTRRPFSLYCAYPVSLVDGDPASADAVRGVCDLHSAMHGARTPDAMRADTVQPVIRFFDRALESPAEARKLVREVLARWGEDHLADDAALVISELASNVLRHTGHGFAVHLSRTGGSVRAAVSDASAEQATPCEALRHDASGRGLMIVNSLAAQWGQEPTVNGKIVWADLARSR